MRVYVRTFWNWLLKKFSLNMDRQAPLDSKPEFPHVRWQLPSKGFDIESFVDQLCVGVFGWWVGRIVGWVWRGLPSPPPLTPTPLPICRPFVMNCWAFVGEPGNKRLWGLGGSEASFWTSIYAPSRNVWRTQDVEKRSMLWSALPLCWTCVSIFLVQAPFSPAFSSVVQTHILFIRLFSNFPLPKKQIRVLIIANFTRWKS